MAQVVEYKHETIYLVHSSVQENGQSKFLTKKISHKQSSYKQTIAMFFASQSTTLNLSVQRSGAKKTKQEETLSGGETSSRTIFNIQYILLII